VVQSAGTVVQPASIEPGWFSLTVQSLLGRAQAELDRAEGESDPSERFRHAHLAALRAASALVAVRGGGRGRTRPRPVWDLLSRSAPELGAWAAYFRGGAGLRAALEAGRDVGVSGEQADHVLVMARMFLRIVTDSSVPRAS
jgi:hypothetical protein